jgi:hypothetical protein
LLGLLCEQVNNALTELSLKSNRIGDKGAAAIGNGLKVSLRRVCS